ncbi:SDR family oxidoreductase [uncultured Litoreibacter sp.]|uniref:SDR family oxidoreductase n=1 Tax=uncultured Litoreibacter sp. TaxID=1392394 RepID=UPI00260E64C2|nr:SDR family oxidoreductase [uncultured Litoreibacter sp.]
MIQGRALVTGAADRLGRALALQLADMGFDVAVHYGTSEDAALETVAMIEAKGRKAAALQADLLDMDAAEALVPAAAQALNGPLSVLVNNASIFEYDTLASATRENWDRHMGSNFQAPFLLTQAFARQAPDVAADENAEPVAQAAIINMIDQRVRKLTPEFMTYTLAKMGLWALTQTSAQALAPAVRVNAIGPGPTVQGIRQSGSHFTKQRAATVLGRGSNPQDVTAALEYILKSPALTGQLLCIDGGQHLGWQTPDVIGVE